MHSVRYQSNWINLLDGRWELQHLSTPLCTLLGSHTKFWFICPVRTADLQERLSTVQEQLRQAETDLEELQGEKSAKYRELKKREETIKGQNSMPC